MVAPSENMPPEKESIFRRLRVNWPWVLTGFSRTALGYRAGVGENDLAKTDQWWRPRVDQRAVNQASGVDREMRQLAKAHGVQSTWRDADGKRHAAPLDSLVAVLRGLGVPLARKEDAADVLASMRTLTEPRVEPVAVAWDGAPFVLTLRAPRRPRALGVTVTAEDGTVLDLKPRAWHTQGRHDRFDSRESIMIRIAGPVPFGVHRVSIDVDGNEVRSAIISAPVHLPEASSDGRRMLGVFVPGHEVGSHVAAPQGDLRSFATLARHVRDLGADVVATTPVLSAFHGAGEEPYAPSPYQPVSRLYWNELCCNPGETPAGATASQTGWPDHHDDRRAAHQRRETIARALDALEPRRVAALRDAVSNDPRLARYAQFRAARQRGEPVPAHDRTPATADVVGDSIARYHAFTQVICGEQVAALHAAVRADDGLLGFELPLGVHPEGFDVAEHPDLFVASCRLGTPPDRSFPAGRVVSSPPVSPTASRAAVHQYWRACLDRQLEVAGLLRLEHVGALQRQWWVPDGAPANEGVFVTAPCDELYALLSLAAHRHGAVIVGDHVGEAPESQRALQRHRVHSAYVAQDHLEPGGDLLPPPRRSVAALDTPQTQSFASFWRGLDDEARAGVMARLRTDITDDDDRDHTKQSASGAVGATFLDPSSALEQALAWLASSRADIVMVNLEDVLTEEGMHRRAGSARTLGDIVNDARVARVLRRIAEIRRRGLGP